MGVILKCKIYEVRDKVGRVKSRLIRLPRNIVVGKSVCIAGGRLLIIDPRGEIDENELLEFYERELEQKIWDWCSGRQKRAEDI